MGLCVVHAWVAADQRPFGVTSSLKVTTASSWSRQAPVQLFKHNELSYHILKREPYSGKPVLPTAIQPVLTSP